MHTVTEYDTPVGVEVLQELVVPAATGDTATIAPTAPTVSAMPAAASRLERMHFLQRPAIVFPRVSPAILQNKFRSAPSLMLGALLRRDLWGQSD
jgi:hypothetical protein